MVGRGRLRGRVLAAILFTDVAGSTELIARLGDDAWRALLARYREAVRRALRRFGGTEVDAAGDGFFALFETPAAALRCAVAIRAEAQALDLEVRSAVHAGEVEVADGRATGIAVHIAARIEALASAGGIMASATARDLAAGSGFEFADAGEHELRGVPGLWRLYRASPVATAAGPVAATMPSRRAAPAFSGGGPRALPGLSRGAATAALAVVIVIGVVLVATRPQSGGQGPSPSTLPAGAAPAVAHSPTAGESASPVPTVQPATLAPATSRPATTIPTETAQAASAVPTGATDTPEPQLLGDGPYRPGVYVLGYVPGRPVVTLADEWNGFFGVNYQSLAVANRSGNRIIFAAATTFPTTACGGAEQPLTGDPADAMLVWLRTNAALKVGPSVARGSAANASTQVDVDVIAKQACAGDPPTVLIVNDHISSPGVTIRAGPTVRLLIHSLGTRVVVVVVEAPTVDEFQQFLPQADAVLTSLAWTD